MSEIAPLTYNRPDAAQVRVGIPKTLLEVRAVVVLLLRGVGATATQADAGVVNLEVVVVAVLPPLRLQPRVVVLVRAHAANLAIRSIPKYLLPPPTQVQPQHLRP